MGARVEHSEEELVSLLNQGDEAALHTLYDRYVQRLYLFILRTAKSPELAEDVVQDVFVRIWQNRARIEPTRSFKAYIFAAAKNHLINLLQRIQRESNILHEISRYAQVGENSTDRTLDFEERNALIMEAVQKLPPQCRAVFERCKLQGMSYKQVAAELAISEGTVNSQMVKATKIIRKYIDLKQILLLLIALIAKY